MRPTVGTHSKLAMIPMLQTETEALRGEIAFPKNREEPRLKASALQLPSSMQSLLKAPYPRLCHLPSSQTRRLALVLGQSTVQGISLLRPGLLSLSLSISVSLIPHPTSGLLSGPAVAKLAPSIWWSWWKR